MLVSNFNKDSFNDLVAESLNLMILCYKVNLDILLTN